MRARRGREVYRLIACDTVASNTALTSPRKQEVAVSIDKCVLAG